MGSDPFLSRSDPVGRLVGMSAQHRGTLWKWMAVVIAAHLAVSVVHGSAHDGAHVTLSPAATFFVFAVILAGPLVGLALSWRNERLGSAIVAATMVGALVFGIVNHFVLHSPDQVSHVQAQWRLLFGTTAVLLAITEMAGAGLAVLLIRERRLS